MFLFVVRKKIPAKRNGSEKVVLVAFLYSILILHVIIGIVELAANAVWPPHTVFKVQARFIAMVTIAEFFNVMFKNAVSTI